MCTIDSHAVIKNSLAVGIILPIKIGDNCVFGRNGFHFNYMPVG
jgi:hypothetical protein